jgi:hypothetical protein
MTGLRIPEAKADDATVCGRIMFDAFESRDMPCGAGLYNEPRGSLLPSIGY